MEKETTKNNVMEQLYTCEEVAKRYHVKSFTVRMWIRDGKLRGIRPGKNYLITESALLNFEKNSCGKENGLAG